MCLSIFCHQFHPQQTPCVFSAAPISVLLSDLPAHCDHIYVTPAYLTPFDSRQLRNMLSINLYPPPLSQYHFSILLYIYLYPINKFLSSLSITHSLSLSIYPQRLSHPADPHFITMNYLTIHSLTICSLYLYFITHCISHTLSMNYPGPMPPPYLLYPAKKLISELTSSYSQQLIVCKGMMISALYCSLISDRLGLSQLVSDHSVMLFLLLLWNF